ncbi:MAG TPA: 3-phosphoshikimate 1-carboxyvinyltransferase [Actinomycetota bacterium]|jgi:3-phosphoshikimate 1-carboxyvinyltransferase|nr:3-phosphoshikimate 1-carboxyvinyltransferase [Actinomycetota bacterium]
MKRAHIGGLTPLRVRVPGDKSISHRAALLAAMASGTSRIAGFSPAGDCAATLNVLKTLGVSFSGEDGVLTVQGAGLTGLKTPQASIGCSRSGTTMRLTTGVLAGRPFESRLTGHPQLLRRPMRRIAEPLLAMGAAVELAHGDTAPITVRGGNLEGIDYEPPVASAQVKSAVLLAGLQAEGATQIVEKVVTRDHTERLLRAMGAPIGTAIGARGIETSVSAADLDPIDIEVPGDLSSASVLIAAALVTGTNSIVQDVGLNPTRCGFLRVLERMGAELELDIHAEEPEPRGDLFVRPGPLTATAVLLEEIPSLIDELPLLGVLATQAEGITVIEGAAELRAKESDRIEGLVNGLRALGADVRQLADGFVVRGPTRLGSAVCDACDDHRLAMALSVGALVAEGPVRIAGVDYVDDSFPGFERTLASFR